MGGCLLAFMQPGRLQLGLAGGRCECGFVSAMMGLEVRAIESSGRVLIGDNRTSRWGLGGE